MIGFAKTKVNTIDDKRNYYDLISKKKSGKKEVVAIISCDL